MSKFTPPTFLFLELIDSHINYVFHGLRLIFQNDTSKHNIHTTVRGPYRHPIPASTIEKFQDKLGNIPLLIQGTGYFAERNNYVVFLRMHQENLRRIWSKRDYPISVYGFNPHISVYVGNNERLALDILSFLKREDLALFCYDYKLTAYVSKQENLFADSDFIEDVPSSRISDRIMSTSSGGTGFIGRGAIKSDLFERAKVLLKSHKG